MSHSLSPCGVDCEGLRFTHALSPSAIMEGTENAGSNQRCGDEGGEK